MQRTEEERVRLEAETRDAQRRELDVRAASESDLRARLDAHYGDRLRELKEKQRTDLAQLQREAQARVYFVDTSERCRC